MRKVIYIILFFLFIFGTKTSIGLDASIICNILFLCFTFVLVGKNYFFPKSVFYLFAFLFVDLLVCIVYPIIQQTYDFEFISTKINLFVSLLNTYNISYYFYRKNIKYKCHKSET